LTLRFDSARSRRTNRNVEQSIFAVSRSLSSPTVISENLDGYWICILILFIETRFMRLSLSHATYQQADFAVDRRQIPKSQGTSETDARRFSRTLYRRINCDTHTHTHTRSQLRPTINRRRSVTLTNHRQVTRIAHYYSRINVIRCVVDIAHYVY